jgi:hypothetical protein
MPAMARWVGSAARSGAVARNVKCEKCGRWYHYMLLREGTADAGRSDESEAADAAAAWASYRLTRGLETGVDVVPCPDCGWVQAEMAGEARRRAGRPWTWISVCLLGAAGLILLFAYAPGVAMPDWELRPDVSRAVQMSSMGCAAAGVLAWVIRTLARARANPNAGFPKWPRRIAGAITGHSGKASAEAVQRRQR